MLNLLTKLDCETRGKGALLGIVEENEYVLLFSIGLDATCDFSIPSEREDVMDLGMSATDTGILLILIPYGLVDILPVISPDLANVALLFANISPVVEAPGF